MNETTVITDEVAAAPRPLTTYEAMKAARWNALVSPKMRLIGSDSTHLLFLHATKGHRRIAKRRLWVN